MTTFLLWVLAFLLVDLSWKGRANRRQSVGLGLLAVAAIAASLVLLPNLLYLGKVAGRLMMPVGLIWAGLGALAGYRWVERDRRRTVAAVSAFVAFSVAGNVPIGGALVASLESPYTARDEFGGPPLDAVFVLGGSTSQSPSSGVARLADSGDRLLTAARVFKARDVGTVVTSGSSIPGIGQVRDVASESADVLVDLGVPAARILELPEPKNSAEEVAAYQALAQQHGWQRVAVVTSAWHLRRVERLARSRGFAAEPIPADFRGSDGWDGLLSVIPDAGGFRNIQRACWEYLGAAMGR